MNIYVKTIIVKRQTTTDTWGSLQRRIVAGPMKAKYCIVTSERGTYSFSSETGLTMIELVIAAGILAIALGILFGSLISINVMGQVADGRSQASTILAGVLEDARRMPFEDLLEYESFPIDVPGMEVAVQLEAVTSNGSRVPLPLPAGSSVSPATLPNPLEIQATLFWTIRGDWVFSLTSSTFHGR